MKVTPSQILVFLCLAQTANAALTASVSSSSTLWTPLVGNFDSATDLNDADANIVGDTVNHGMLFIFDDNGTPDNHADGWLGFRVRFDAVASSSAQPDSVVGIAIDAGADGSINAFIAYDPKAISNSPRIVLSAGTGTTPGNTSIGTNASTYNINDPGFTNFNYRSVVAGSDSVLADVTTAVSGDIDYYVSFMVPFADVIAVLGTGVDDRTVFRYLAYTSTQGNNINQDYGGVDGTPASTSTWVSLGAFSSPASVPEPSSALSALSSLAAFLLLRKRR